MVMEDTTTEVVKIKHEVEEEESSSPSTKLGLAIGGGDDVEKKRRRREVLTEAQMSELEQQKVIYHYIVRGLPIPFQLVHPIWKSLAGPTFPNPGFYQQYPSFGRYAVLDYKGITETEPGRCRRTDGKKWRCRKDVVSNEKYCQNHMHRGRQRSRKHVEASEFIPPGATLLKSSEVKLFNSKKNLQIPTQKGLLLMAQPSNVVSVCHSPTTYSSGYHEKSMNSCAVAHTGGSPSYITTTIPAAAIPSLAAAVPSTTIGLKTATTSTSVDNNFLIAAKDDGHSRLANNNCIIGGSRNTINVGSNIAPALGFSPKSVLQAGHMTLVNCNSLYFDNGSGIELEPGRCRRTDGKRWRCKSDVLPDQKYCDRHIHRGVKQRRTSDPASTSACATNSTRPSQFTGTTGEIPSTSLTMYIPARSLPIQNDEQSDCSSVDSDATVTDTSFAG